MRAPLTFAVLSVLTLVGCDGGGLELSVDVRSDVPLFQLDAMRAEIVEAQGAPPLAMLRSVSADTPLREGVRVADFSGLLPGSTMVRVELLRGPNIVLERTVRLSLEADQVIQVHLSSACLDAPCAGDTPQCSGGACVSADCGGGAPAMCGERSCRVDSECPAKTGCAVAYCARFECVCDDDAPPPGTDGGPRPDAGEPEDAGEPHVDDDAGPPPVDAGPPPVDAGPTQCTGTETDAQSRACGACGEGTQQRSRTCSGGAWGAFSAWSTCATDAQCAPNQTSTREQPCGNCGSQTQTRTCSATTCRWGSYANTGGCDGQGACAPGATRGGCDQNSGGAATGCGVNRCNSSCQWGTACELAPGAACLSGGGSNFSCCTPAGGGAGWRFCSPTSCQWFDCASHSCG